MYTQLIFYEPPHTRTHVRGEVLIYANYFALGILGILATSQYIFIIIYYCITIMLNQQKEYQHFNIISIILLGILGTNLRATKESETPTDCNTEETLKSNHILERL